MNNLIVIVLDGIGVGELPDASEYGDEGSNTLGNLSKNLGALQLHNLQSLGLGNIIEIAGISKNLSPLASYGKMREISPGKDSTTGHWELAGINVNFKFPLYPGGFPQTIIEKFLKLNGLKGFLGNTAASGTEIIQKLGIEHVKTGYPIVYTSADSVFQIAAHEEIIPLDELYRICSVSRKEIFTGKDTIGRVIARPFTGEEGNFTRTTNRKDFSIDPVQDTILDVLHKNNITTIGIGKINDLFNNRGIKIQLHTKSNYEGIERIIEYSGKFNNSFIFANLVDFDVYYGHRNDSNGFYDCLKEFDRFIPDLLASLDDSDILIITSDHGNDPTDISTDHTREFVPLLFYRKNVKGIDLNIRNTFSDVAKTVADYFKVNNNFPGESFLG